MRRCQTVLVVDDDAAIRRLLATRLSSECITVRIASSAADAERLIDDIGSEIDLILLDVGLPDADGFALCGKFRQRRELAETPIIFLTGRDSPEDTLRGFEVGGTDYIVKPFDFAILHARVSAALRKQQFFHERCEAEATLRESEARYRHLTEHCFDMISRHDSAGRYIDVSPACTTLLGYQPAELIGRSAYEFIHRDDIPVVEATQKSLLRQDPPQPVTFRICRKDGSHIWVESMCRILPESNFEINCVTRDVTARKQAEDAIRASEAKLHAITAQLPAIVWTTDACLNVDSVYGALLFEFGIEGGQIIGHALPEVIPTIVGDESDSIVEGHRSAMCGKSVNARFARDGRDFELVIEPLLGADGMCVGCLGTAFDVTERRRVEEIERHRAALEEAVDAMEQILGVIGHELRTPLTGLRVMAEFLLSDHNPDDEQAGFLNMIHDEAIRMASMVNTLLEAARINSGKAQWNWSTFDLEEICHNVIKIVRHTHDNQNVTFGCEVVSSPGDESMLRDDMSVMMNGDRDAMHRLFMNLLTNAARHTGEGLVMVKVVEIWRGDERWIEIQVRDTGEGIPQNVLDKLCVPFALNSGMIDHDEDGGSSVGHGCGLGLAICRGIVLAHGGTIQFDSHLGTGTTVDIAIRADLDGPAETHPHAIFVNEVSR